MKRTATRRRPVLVDAAAAAVPGRPTSASPLGDRIRHLRQERRWSLSKFGAQCGIASSTLSKVENGRLSLAYDRLLAVAQGFGMSLSDFLAFTEDDSRGSTGARISWARRDAGQILRIGAYTYQYLCTNLRRKKMVPLIGQVHARSLDEFGPLLRHEGEEFLWVLKGQVQVHTDFYNPELLQAGEGVYLDSRMGHAAINAGPDEAWVLSVSTDPPIPQSPAESTRTAVLKGRRMPRR